MQNKHPQKLTATEVKERLAEVAFEFPTPDFSEALDAMLEAVGRTDLVKGQAPSKANVVCLNPRTGRKAKAS